MVRPLRKPGQTGRHVNVRVDAGVAAVFGHAAVAHDGEEEGGHVADDVAVRSVGPAANEFRHVIPRLLRRHQHPPVAMHRLSRTMGMLLPNLAANVPCDGGEAVGARDEGERQVGHWDDDEEDGERGDVGDALAKEIRPLQ